MNGTPPARLGTPPMIDGRPSFAGRQLVKEVLDLDTWGLERLHREPGSLQTLARAITHQAQLLDRIDDQLRRAAVSAIGRLTEVASGKSREIQSHGLLRLLGSDVETLAARYADMADLLRLSCAEYKLTVTELSEAPAPAHSRVKGSASAARARSTAPVGASGPPATAAAPMPAPATAPAVRW
ncbi:hypothetical protein ACFVH7_12310 [Kitasatospora indigofera]|uniref:hypothetical protein n=1 Tax=Kitasatospora indigofera TaxID=67307 RepID=UPI003644CFE4